MLQKHKKWLLLTSILVLLPIPVGLSIWDRLPDTMATHFGYNNQANGFNSKLFAIVGLPIIMLIIHLLAAILTAMDPKRENINPKLYKLILWIVPFISLWVNGIMYSYNLGIEINVSLYLSLLIGLIFIVIGNFLPKARQNYTVGIKLPWTLANEVNWNKTHRLAGFLWMLIGLLFMLLTFIPALHHEWVPVMLVLIMLLGPILYSFLLHVKKGL